MDYSQDHGGKENIIFDGIIVIRTPSHADDVSDGFSVLKSTNYFRNAKLVIIHSSDSRVRRVCQGCVTTRGYWEADVRSARRTGTPGDAVHHEHPEGERGGLDQDRRTHASENGKKETVLVILLLKHYYYYY